jgi:hypothetical protein
MSYRWWAIEVPDGRLPEELTAALSRLLARAGDAQVAVREPEVWTRSSSWSASEYYDGRLLGADAATSLIGKMLASAEFWCRLVTDRVEVHVVEKAVYVGTAEPDMSELLPVPAERVDSSPYAIDRVHFPYYPPADEKFWSDTRRDLGRGAGEILILQQWAAGAGGERWYRVASADDLEAVRRNVIPRALFAAFRHPRMVRRTGPSAPPISHLLGEEPLLANLRVFHDLNVSPLRAKTVVNDQELARIWSSLGERDSVFLWNPDADVSYAAQADPDGRVRAAASFE